ncbi:MAG: primosomal protein N' [Oscillospiraceae bacterium]|nr:primosomal protein N' [Oscillospiraceae bacterium]
MNTSSSVRIADVGVSGTKSGFDSLYSYLVPDELYSAAEAGKRAVVPFGRGNKRRMAVILSVYDTDNADTGKMKYLSALVDPSPIIGKEMLGMLLWLHEMTLCTYYEALSVLIPPGLAVNFTEKYSISDCPSAVRAGLSRQAADLYSSFAEVKNRREREMMISAAFEGSDRQYAEELLRNGVIYEYGELKQRTKNESVTMVRLTDDYVCDPALFRLSRKQKAAVEILAENGAASVKELCYLCGSTPQVIKNLIKCGAAESFEYDVISPSEAEAYKDPDDIVLTPAQQSVYDGISTLIELGKPSAALLFGVTGSGKTPVFAKLIQHTLSLGRNVIVLIPEISLTPQTTARFEALFGDMVSVLHSGLSMSRRMNEYKRIASGGSRIVVGTRSAVFAPLDNIGLIVIDEEGESAYKSGSSPRYHARDAAKKRCAYHNAVLLMASATPSVESYYNARCGRYKLFRMTERYSSRPLPKVDIVDMGTEEQCGTSGTFSARLVREISANLDAGEQSILLLNRRGYYTFISCSSCREPVKCPNCSIPLTYHKINDRLICHYCGYSTEMIKRCPSCGSERMKLSGLGTQKLEDEISDLFPSARLLRMDADTTYSRYAYDRSFTAFENGEYDIMLGTQMIAKGLDFPNVTLVGVLSIDKALFCGDFRSYERTFSLIAQVVGRGGRGEKSGRAIIQTYVPDHYVINLAAQQDYEKFYEQESAMRKALIYPPYCDICVVGFSSADDRSADEASKLFLEMLADKVKAENITFPLRVLGPSRCVYEKINGQYRYRIIIKCRNTADFRSFIRELRKAACRTKAFSDIRMYVDINGDIGL